MKKYKNYINLSALVISFGLTFNSCSESETEKKMGVITISDESIIVTHKQFVSAQMRLGKLSQKEFHKSVKTTGVFDVPAQDKASVSAYFGGYVKTIKLLPGQKVTKGKVLFTLENPAYIQVQQQFLEVKGQLSYLKSDFERQKSLLEEKVTSQKKYLKAEADYKVALAQFESLKKKLALMNINSETVVATNIRSTISIKSPISGIVTSITAEKGMFLNPADVAVTITNTSNLQLLLSVFEKDLPKIKEGQNVQFQLQNASGETYNAEVFLVNRIVDSKTRKATVLAHLMNVENTVTFASGMYIEGKILLSSKTSNALPEQAIVNIENNYYVLIKKNEGDENFDFEKVQVQVGKTENGFIEVLNPEAVGSDTEILIEGAFNLIVE